MASIFSRRTGSSEPESLSIEAIRQAKARLESVLPITPLTHSPILSELTGIEVFLKWDNKLTTGSFKERGALNFLKSLSDKERSGGVCAASAGNHALALSYHAARLKIPCTIIMPRNAPLVKIENTRSFGATVVLEGADFDDARVVARTIAKKESLTIVPAFDDYRIIAGQGTAGIEILDQIENFDAVVASVGGGGYISGIAYAVKEHRPDTYLLGVQSQWAVDGRKSRQKTAGTFLYPGTIADGIAVKRIGGKTQPIIQDRVDEVITLGETDIAEAVIALLRYERTVVEGAGAAALAAVLQKRLPEDIRTAVVLVGGSNIDINLLSRLIDRDMRRRGRLLRLRMAVPDRPGSLAAVTDIISSQGANVLETFHDRSFSDLPGDVDLTFLLEVRNEQHRQSLFEALQQAGIEVSEL